MNDRHYDYEIDKQNIFSEKGQVDFLQTRDFVKEVIGIAGAVRMGKILGSPKTSCSDTFTMMALVDRLVELKEIREITGPEVCGQDRVFVAK